ncbi:MAG: redox-sensing transcriptional repressor Rex [Bacteroidales bacterium]|jgi:redox-sensing transcriptional repressor|nr:redox-sensing transcriptional repressor Rex [Bacteroidales bacterium]NLM91344.1 redox-sensing transcriptional repressor Rex [Bacteroidales bacterium]
MPNKKIEELPGKTVERLSQYRRLLFNSVELGKTNIYSHELARMMNLTPVQVRRDLMLIGYSGSQSKGYVIKDLISLIGKIIDSDTGQRIAIMGMGNLGRAITSYFTGKREKLSIVAAFDNDPQKYDRIIAGVPCYHINKLKEVVQKENIGIAILTVAPQATHEATKLMLEAGVKGILNYTSVPVSVPEGVFLEEYDIITSLEKLAFLVKK